MKMLASGDVAYYFTLPAWARKRDGCPVSSERLPDELPELINRADDLNKRLDDWRNGSDDGGPRDGTVSWLIRWYQRHSKYKKTAPKTQRSYDQGFSLIENHVLDNGRNFGECPVKAVKPKHVDALYERLQWVGTRRRLPMANSAMRAARRMWGLAVRAGHADLNPFEKMDLEATGGRTVPATREQVYKFIRTADERRHPSMALAAMLAFELCQREGNVIGTMSWNGYRAGAEIRIRQHKTDQIIWFPLRDEGGELVPGLIARLDETLRHGTLIVMRDRPDPRTKLHLSYKEDHFRHLFRKIADAAGLPREIKFMGFRHGGLTELGNAGATDQELMSHSGHKSRAMLKVYVKPSAQQATNAARKRRAFRMNQEQMSE